LSVPDVERWLLLGDPGTGKTTLALRQAAVLAEAAIANRSALVPVFIPLSLFGQRMVTKASYSLYEFINEIGEQLQLVDLGGEIRRIARHGEALFILDGADEVPEALRDDALRVVHSGTFPGTGNKLLVTSRRVGASRFVGYHRLEIAPLTINDQRNLM